ncbi:MAG: hypothetical protein NC417_06200 [Candidatus Gastranaerophilales bacterium]|nr:hypothetical protein [Candidatus Gastranaerophilales bacterium]
MEGHKMGEWRTDFIELVKQMENEEQMRDDTGVSQENVFKFFHELEPNEEKNKISEWEKAMGIR